MDSLIEIPSSELLNLRDLFRAHWPNGVEGFCLLNTLTSYPALTELFKFKFYCPEGKITNGMVAISDKDYYQVYICPTTDLCVMEDALLKTKVIDWNRSVAVPSANADVLASLKRLCDRLDLKITYENRCCKYLYDKDSRQFENLSDPENTYVGSLRPEHLNLVDQTWTFHSDHSYELFETLMNNGLTYVLYSSEDHSPLSWITVDEAGAFTHLYCSEDHRKKGYAEYITKVAINNLLCQGRDVLAYTLDDNVKPQKLFKKLGVRFLGYVWWVFLTKKS